MDHPAMMADAFGGMPGFSPFMMLNLSGLCATTKLIQCKQYGISMCDVSRKFDKDPSEAPDLARGDFLERRKIINAVRQWCEAVPGRTEWVPILYAYEIVKSSGKRNSDFGHLIFTDLTLTRFLLIMVFGQPTCGCGNPYHNDYDALTKLQADRWMSLLIYLHHEEPTPSWVRATYITNQHPLDLDLLNSNTKSKPPRNGAPPIFHVTPGNFVPSLLDGELERIDNMLSMDSPSNVPSSSVRARVRGAKKDRPDTSTAWLLGKERNARQCAYCEKVGDHNMPLCSQCKLVRYCDKGCQRRAWPAHKKVCKTAGAA